MLDFTIKIETKIFLGILEQEKEEKNKISLHIKYSVGENVFVDYSLIYEYCMNIINERKWDTIEELIKYIYLSLKHEFSEIMKLRISLTKKTIGSLNKCQSVTVEYEE